VSANASTSSRLSADTHTIASVAAAGSAIGFVTKREKLSLVCSIT